MKQRTYLKKGLALCLCALCLLSFMVPAFAAKKETTSFRHASVKMNLAYTRTVYSGKEKTPAVTSAQIMLPMRPAAAPSMDLLGLTAGHSFRLPKWLPIK